TRRPPRTAPLRASLRFVDAGVCAFGEEAHRIRDTELDYFSVREGVERIGMVARPDRGVCPEPQRVVLIHPGVVRSLGGAVPSRKGGPRQRIEGPALWAAVAIIGARSIE